jgi:Site-specific recombinase XerD
MDIDDLDLTIGQAIIRRGKGGKPRMVWFGKKTRKALRSYIRERSDKCQALWVTNNGTRLTYWGLNQLLRRRSVEAKIDKPGLHDFRRAFALNCLRGGMDVYSLQRLMGHSDLQVLRRYLAQTDDDVREAHAKAGPVDDLL